MSDKYYELQIKINPDMEDIISELCFEIFSCEGIVLAEEAYKDLEMVSTTEGTLKVFITNDEPIDDVIVKSRLNSQREILLSRGLSDEDLGSWDFVLSQKDNEDWSKKWKEKWDITHVSDRITIVPDWLEYAPKNEEEVVIRLEPGCAFGTGTHQTTQLCMHAMEKYLKPEMSVADIGMGSGILSICAVRMGAKYAYGCDIDETVIDVAKENAIKNGIALIPSLNKDVTSYPPLEGSPLSDNSNITAPLSGCYFELGTADKIKTKFDFVMANILHNVLFDIMGDLKNLMNDEGYLALSGILDEKKPVVLEAIERENLEIIDEIHQDQWVGFVVRKK